MSVERRKILEMIQEGIISIEEGEELLRVLENTKPEQKKKNSKSFKTKLDKDLQKTKEGLLKAKDRLVEEYEKIDFGKAKTSVKKGIEKIDKAVAKVDKAIIQFGEKLFNQNKDKSRDFEDETNIDNEGEE